MAAERTNESGHTGRFDKRGKIISAQKYQLTNICTLILVVQSDNILSLQSSLQNLRAVMEGKREIMHRI